MAYASYINESLLSLSTTSVDETPNNPKVKQISNTIEENATILSSQERIKALMVLKAMKKDDADKEISPALQMFRNAVGTVIKNNRKERKYKLTSRILFSRKKSSKREDTSQRVEEKPSYSLLSKYQDILLTACQMGKDRHLDINNIVVFGDSLSDSQKKMHKKTNRVLLSSNQYYKGRFTNGKTWAEQLYFKKEGHPVPVINHAEGGAVATRHKSFDPAMRYVSTFKEQIQTHQENQPFHSKDLVITLFGANDYLTFSNNNTDMVTDKIIQNIDELITQNAIHQFLVLGLPDLSKTPSALEKSKNYQLLLHLLVIQHNNKLRDKIELLKRKHGNHLKIEFFDPKAVIDELIVEANQLGYNTTESYQQGYIDLAKVFSFGRCNSSGELNSHHTHVFHDDVHPSQEVHSILSAKVQAFIYEKFTKPQCNTTPSVEENQPSNQPT